MVDHRHIKTHNYFLLNRDSRHHRLFEEILRLFVKKDIHTHVIVHRKNIHYEDDHNRSMDLSMYLYYFLVIQ